MSFTHLVIAREPVVTIALYGELIDRSEGNEFMHVIDTMMEEGHNKFILELSELKYMNSTGLNILINLLTKTRKNGGDLVISGISKKVKELLIITKLNSVFTVTDTTEEAVARFNS